MSTAGGARTPREAWNLRRPERELLGLCLLCVGLGFLMLLGSSHAAGRPLTGADLLPLFAYGAALAALHGALVAARFRGDQVLTAVVALLSGIGLLVQARMQLTAGAGAATLHPALLPVGLVVMTLVATAGGGGRYARLAGGFWVWGGVSILLVAVLLLTGERFRGGVYGAGFVTPTEALKVTVVLFLAGYIAHNAKALAKWGGPIPYPPLRDLAPLAGGFAVLLGLLLVQRDLGMVVILGVLILALLTAGTGRVGYLVYGAIGASAAGWLALALFDHARRRVEAWLSPFDDPTGGSWQVLQGLSGMFAGGLWGEGFGRGSPQYTPIAGSDFVYAVLGEELGFAGTLLVVVLFLLLLQRGLAVAARTRLPFGALSALGLTLVIAVQTFLNIGGVTKLVPLTGITLPFISHGGSSLMTAFVAVGLILAISDGEPARPKTGARAAVAPSQTKGQKRPRARTKPAAPPATGP
jgi:cell division protein FtsW (lipid II flippase)